MNNLTETSNTARICGYWSESKWDGRCLVCVKAGRVAIVEYNCETLRLCPECLVSFTKIVMALNEEG